MPASSDPERDELRLLQIAFRVQTVAELHARLTVAQREPFDDVLTMNAWLKAAWIEARPVIEFFVGGSGVVHVGRYLPGWSLPKDMGKKLRGHRNVISQHVAHLLLEPRVDGGFDLSMPNDLVRASEVMLAEMERRSDCNQWTRWVRAPVRRARDALDQPDRVFRIEDLVAPETVQGIVARTQRLADLTNLLRSVPPPQTSLEVDLGRLAPGILTAAEHGLQGSIELIDELRSGSRRLVVSQFVSDIDETAGPMALIIARVAGEEDVALAVFNEASVQVPDTA